MTAIKTYLNHYKNKLKSIFDLKINNLNFVLRKIGFIICKAACSNAGRDRLINRICPNRIIIKKNNAKPQANI